MHPAVEAADPAIGPRVDAQADGVAVAPHRAFVEGRLHLAMAAENFPLPADEQQGAIDRAEGLGVALGGPDHDIEAGILGGFAKLVGGRAWDLDGIGEIFGHRLPGQWRRSSVAEERITRQPGLAEGCDGGAHGAGLPDQAARFGGRGVAVERYGRRLDRGKPEMHFVYRHERCPRPSAECGGSSRRGPFLDSIQQLASLFPPSPCESFLADLVCVLAGLDVVGFATKQHGVDLRKPWDTTLATPLAVWYFGRKHPD